ncbi:DUF4230 domain-containing protein [Salisaeta longa]|uniref:DUF4230 domain-containing protein n=1 Tax=Salisaeta longa TaxID=503170 RepID=UPI0003B41F0C|nr:DUF4230 domain-containing protein [Salisaeta longa]
MSDSASPSTNDATGRSPWTARQKIAAWGGVVVGLLVAVAVAVWQVPPGAATVERTVITTLQEETPASFLVTGQLDITVEQTVQRTASVAPWFFNAVRAWAPSFDWDQGTTQATVRVPGTVSYGFNVQQLSADMIDVAPDGRIVVELPPLTVHAVEPHLGQMKMRTTATGWMQLASTAATDSVKARALRTLQPAFEKQARRHLQQATQPRINTAQAVQQMLTPALRAAGIDTPTFRFQIRNDLTLHAPETPSDSSLHPTP